VNVADAISSLRRALQAAPLRWDPEEAEALELVLDELERPAALLVDARVNNWLSGVSGPLGGRTEIPASWERMGGIVGPTDHVAIEVRNDGPGEVLIHAAWCGTTPDTRVPFSVPFDATTIAAGAAAVIVGRVYARVKLEQLVIRAKPVRRCR
jgi:hypothetical protein